MKSSTSLAGSGQAIVAGARRVAGRLLPPPVLRQGPHPDPLDPASGPPHAPHWQRGLRQAYASPQLQLFRDSLLMPGSTDRRASVLDDLASYSGLDPDECVRRSRYWETWSVQEWSASDRTDTDGLTDFFRTTQSWSFDLLWHCYLQAEGYAHPASVVALRSVGPYGQGRSHLDLGSGAGVTSQLFARAGFETTAADLSTSLLDFARYRLARRGESARFLDLNDEKLEPGRYDVITAIDTLTHIPDLREAAATLHGALRPGGLLVANFAVRPPDSAENAWHLYEDDLALRAVLHQAGFLPWRRVLEWVTYRRVDQDDPAVARQLRSDRMFLTSPARRALRRARRDLAVTVHGWKDTRVERSAAGHGRG